MPDMSIINLLLLCFFSIALGVAIIAVKLNKKLSLKLDKALGLINSLHGLHEANQTKIEAVQNKQEVLKQETKQQTAAQLAELESSMLASQQADVNAINHTVDKLVAEVEDMSQQDPAAKMYAKAHSLVESGASIDEIMEACDLPKAEVEILIGFQKKARK